MNISDYIETNPGVRFGKPCMKGTRISVGDVLGWLGSGMSIQEIIDDFPELTEMHIRACLMFAANREHLLRDAS